MKKSQKVYSTAQFFENWCVLELEYVFLFCWDSTPKPFGSKTTTNNATPDSATRAYAVYLLLINWHQISLINI